MCDGGDEGVESTGDGGDDVTPVKMSKQRRIRRGREGGKRKRLAFRVEWSGRQYIREAVAKTLTL